MDPILSLIAASDRQPPEALEKKRQSSPFFEVNREAFLFRSPSGGRLHYATGQGIAVAEPETRPAGDLQPFVLTSGFAAAAWLDGRVPLNANAVQLADGRLRFLQGGARSIFGVAVDKDVQLVAGAQPLRASGPLRRAGATC